MQNLRFDHIHLRSSDPEATARFFETMFGAEVTRGVYPPGTLYPGKMRVTMLVGGQKILVAPTHPHDAMAPAPAFGAYRADRGGSGTYLAFIRGPDGIMVELVQQRR
jgi:catechol 2,3-dioxygenase-like lactoylglutathione lyase family enzyme